MLLALHFVFASEHYGAGGNEFRPTVYDVDPAKPINSWKEAWESVKQPCSVSVRFHDLRHTCVTRMRMLEGGVPLSVVASILGWSPATTVRMAKRYGHIGQTAQRLAVAVLDRKVKKPARKRGHKKGHSEEASVPESSATHCVNWLLGLDSNQQPSG